MTSFRMENHIDLHVNPAVIFLLPSYIKYDLRLLRNGILNEMLFCHYHTLLHGDLVSLSKVETFLKMFSRDGIE